MEASIVSVSTPMGHPVNMIHWDGNGKMHFLMKGISPGLHQRKSFPSYMHQNGGIYVFSRLAFERRCKAFLGT